MHKTHSHALYFLHKLFFLADKHKKEIELQQNICYGPVTTPGFQGQVDSEPSLTELHEEDIQTESNIAYEHTSFISSGGDHAVSILSTWTHQLCILR